MCGIVGFIQTDTKSEEWESILSTMADSIHHRGPDDSGLWFDPEAGIGMGHRRLSIVDLSSLGHQPMSSQSGRFIMVYNGEVYNYPELKSDLCNRGYQFRGHSDTEVLLSAFEEWGVEATIKRAIGMFAIALWDVQTRQLHLVRDRLGEKPLYYGWLENAFVFGSELKALKRHPQFKLEINRGALALLMRHNYIPTPHSIYQGIYKLHPGTILSIRQADISIVHKPVYYWCAKEISENGIKQPFIGSANEAIEQLDALLRDAVQRQMVADVPLGAFLSGGIDSSTIVALMQAQSTQPVKTFSIGFTESAYNEADHALAVAKYLGTEHTELYVTPADAMAIIPQLPHLFDEPFADSSQIPTFLVAKLARQHVTVSLSGDGGDELFGGYTRYAFGEDLWAKISKIPQSGRKFIGTAIKAFPAAILDSSFSWLGPTFVRYGRNGAASDKLHKLAEILDVPNAESLYLRSISHWKNPTDVVINSKELPTPLTDDTYWAVLPDFYQRMMYLDTITYLPDDILVKVDRASMGVSLETRVPLLDHRIVEFAWSLPLTLKVREGKSKWILRQVLNRYVPQSLVERPKMGFGVPIGRWLKCDLRDWVENLLDERKLQQDGYFNPIPIRKKWHEHTQSKHDWAAYLWDVLMFQAWLEENR